MRASRRSTRNVCLVVSSVTLVIAVSTRGHASTSVVKPAIDHARVASVPNDGYPQVEAVIESDIEGEEIRRARACFRAQQHPDLYSADMQQKQQQVLGCSDGDDGNVFVGVFPIPDASTSSIVYYIEATDDAYVTERTQAHTATTSSEPVGARFSGTEPNITVIATVEGAPETPPGFRKIGIVAFVSVAGVTTSLTSGMGTTVAIGTAAAAAGAVGVGVLASGSESTTTTTGTVTSTSTTTSTTTTSTPPTSTTTSARVGAPRACFTTTPDPPRLEPEQPMSFDASCSVGDRDGGPTPVERYTWEFGDGSPAKVGGRERREVVHVFEAPGFYTVTLTVTNGVGPQDTTSRNVRVAEPPLPPPQLSKGFALTPFFPSAGNGAQLSNVRLNGQSVIPPSAPGTTVTVTLNFQIIDIPCPGCIDQILVGFANASSPIGCIFNGIPGPGGFSGSASFPVTVPTIPGTYFLGFDRSQQFSCVLAWWSGIPGTDVNRHFARIVVE